MDKEFSRHDHFLNTPIEETPVPDQVRDYMQVRGLQNIRAMLETYSSSQLLRIDGFDYHNLVDLYQFLSQNGCEHMLRQ